MAEGLHNILVGFAILPFTVLAIAAVVAAINFLSWLTEDRRKR